MNKKYYIKPEDIKELFHTDGPDGCIASDRIMVDGEKIGYMCREYADHDGDSGWRFTAGDEDEEYMSNPENAGVYTLNAVANVDMDIIPFLNSPVGSGFFRDENGKLVKDDFNIIARQEIDEILYEHNIADSMDYERRDQEELAEIYENIKVVQENYGLSDDEVEEMLKSIFSDY
ncbi:hypothetical protein HMPREF9099_01968 [Lachnospiraceae bacterium oral taxon 082 str. F0431]|mgnify:CR=1 FL=1|jgi:hypothetical protein|nr:hypothetical protein HMPREF9099_01968 [Lachnospiraceae bacterium oral taxon 082 str. F0431]